MERPPQSKREHLQRLVSGKNNWGKPLSKEVQAKGFKGWHERGYLPHCDKPGLVQFITFRLWDSMPASRHDEWDHLLAVNLRSGAPRPGRAGCSSNTGAQSIALREQRMKLEEYLDRGLGECFLRNPRIAALAEIAMLHHHGLCFQMLAWVIMPNHVHALITGTIYWSHLLTKAKGVAHDEKSWPETTRRCGIGILPMGIFILWGNICENRRLR